MEPIDLRGVSMGQQLFKAIDKMHNGLLAAIDEIHDLKRRVAELERALDLRYDVINSMERDEVDDARGESEGESEPPSGQVS